MHSFIHFSNKKEGRQLDLASYPSVCDDDIQFFIYHQGKSSSSSTLLALGVSLNAPNAAEPMIATVAKIAIEVSYMVHNYIEKSVSS